MNVEPIHKTKGSRLVCAGRNRRCGQDIGRYAAPIPALGLGPIAIVAPLGWHYYSVPGDFAYHLRHQSDRKPRRKLPPEAKYMGLRPVPIDEKGRGIIGPEPAPPCVIVCPECGARNGIGNRQALV